MTPDDFVTLVRRSVIAENLVIYKDLYDSTCSNGANDPYWDKSLALYTSLDEEQRKVFFDVIRQTMSDTVSNIFGIIDGAASLEGADDELSLLATNKNEKLSGDLQDLFLEQEERRTGR